MFYIVLMFACSVTFLFGALLLQCWGADERLTEKVGRVSFAGLLFSVTFGMWYQVFEVYL